MSSDHLQLLSLALLVACKPAIGELGGGDLDDGDPPGSVGDGGGSDGATGGDALDDGGSSGGGTVDGLTLRSGTWIVSSVGIDDDPCEWESVLANYYGMPLFGLLPSSFEVAAEAGAFTIEANEFGARGPVDCEIDGAAFSCATQTVAPTAYSLGSVGWEYAVVFEGEVLDDGRLRGAASVSFPAIDLDTQRTLDFYGIDPGDCMQDWLLELAPED